MEFILKINVLESILRAKMHIINKVRLKKFFDLLNDDLKATFIRKNVNSHPKKAFCA